MSVEEIKTDIELLELKIETLQDESLKGVFRSFALVLKKIDAALDELADYITSIDEDLSDLETDLQEEEDMITITCKRCGEEFFVPVAEYYDGNEIICPNCGEVNVIEVKEG